MRRFLIILAFGLIPTAAQAQNISVNDIIELSKAGLSEQALIALIEVNPTVFPVDVETLKRLKSAAVAPNVITAMIKSGRTPPPPPLPFPQPVEVPPPGETRSATPPQVVVIEHRDEPRVREVPVAVPVYVAVPVGRVRHDRRDRDDDIVGRGRVRPAEKVVEPVFWGWGGKLRPDAWKPSIETLQKDAKIEKQRK